MPALDVSEDRGPAPRRGLDTGVKVAVAALVVAAVAFFVVLAAGGGDEKGESLTPQTAQAGQCVDLTEQAGRIDLTAAGCSRPHDAEIVLTTAVGEAIAGPAELDDAEGVCTGLMDPADVARLADGGTDVDWGLLIDEPSNIDPTDRLVCYVRAADGRLDERLLDAG
ncbi:hypothetical protein [Nocardioides rubriscoriae]|uniref:hypothetical protein n=1 Tax=Nocardioides rubriscoriae TaxID=642762 RepID=UPI0011DF538E|nr:hypothetical protein [Nocardioides rubriscoriae]